MLQELMSFMAEEQLIPAPACQEGITAVLQLLHETAMDVPFAPQLVSLLIFPNNLPLSPLQPSIPHLPAPALPALRHADLDIA